MKFHVEFGERSYDVDVRPGALSGIADLVKNRAPMAQRAVVVTSPSIKEQPWFEVDSGLEQSVILVPEGESAKTIETVSGLLDKLAALKLSRSDVVIAVGGGAITDVAGFAAAIYLRGIALIQVPTSLVGQVDAAIGGKTGINIDAGKNLVGAFYQPLGVLCDSDVLETLPEREILSGLGEIAKCWLLEGRRASDLDAATREDLIELSIRLKADVVSGDEREGGRRAILNYGHTLGHAVERIALERDTDELRHGEAVAIGLGFAIRLALRLGRVNEDEVTNCDEVSDHFGLSRLPSGSFDVDDILRVMAQDKKAHHDLSFVLPGPNGFELVRGIDEAVVREELESYLGAL